MCLNWVHQQLFMAINTVHMLNDCTINCTARVLPIWICEWLCKRSLRSVLTKPSSLILGLHYHTCSLNSATDQRTYHTENNLYPPINSETHKTRKKRSDAFPVDGELTADYQSCDTQLQQPMRVCWMKTESSTQPLLLLLLLLQSSLVRHAEESPQSLLNDFLLFAVSSLISSTCFPAKPSWFSLKWGSQTASQPLQSVQGQQEEIRSLFTFKTVFIYFSLFARINCYFAIVH